MSSEVSPALRFLEALSLPTFPSSFSNLILSNTDFTVKYKFDSPSSTFSISLVESPTGPPLVFKSYPGMTELSVPFLVQIASLVPVRFYFLDPIQGFTLDPPFGFFFRYYGSLQTLRDLLQDGPPITGTSRTLIAAFIAYGMARLEVTQVIHGALHSGNIYISRDQTPIISDWGLCRDYDYFEAEDANDELSWFAPELLLSGHANYNCDVYSYGVLLFEMLEGRRPFKKLTNRELLAARRYGLAKFDYDQTPDEWRSVIDKCTARDPDLRPSFCELYSVFAGGKCFPGTASADVSLVLSHYPLSQVFAPSGMTVRPDEPAAGGTSAAMAILTNASHPEFRDTVHELVSSIDITEIPAFCRELTKHVSTSQDADLVSFLISSSRALCERGPDFTKAITSSDFLRRIPVAFPTAVSDVTAIISKVLLSTPDILPAPLYHAIGISFVYQPVTMLSIMSSYVQNCTDRTPSFWNAVRLYMGLWFLFYDSILSLRYIDVLGHLASVSSDFWAANQVDLTGIAFRFSTSREPFGVLAGCLFLARFCPESLSIAAPSGALLAQTASPCVPRVVLLAQQVFPSVELAGCLFRMASPAAWAALLKYALLGSEHAATLLSVDGWLGAGGDDCIRVALAVFVHTDLRKRLSRMPDFPVFLHSLCAGSRAELLWTAGSVVERIELDAEILTAIDGAGFFEDFFGATLPAEEVSLVKLGIGLADLCGRVAFLERWIQVVQVLIGLVSTRYDELGDDLICILSSFSIYPQTMEIMKAHGLVEYYEGLVRYENYRQHAEFFLSNASQY
jgi:serine/threonine protein kinase